MLSKFQLYLFQSKCVCFLNKGEGEERKMEEEGRQVGRKERKKDNSNYTIRKKS